MRRALLRSLLGLLGLFALSLAALVAWLHADDPVPGFADRQGTLAGATLDSATTDAGHIIQGVRIRSTSGMALDLLIKRPRVVSGRVPLVVILGGHTTGRDAARLVPDTRGRAVVALSYPYAGPHRIKGVRALRWAPDIRRALLDTPPAIQLALDWLFQQPWADTTEVHGIGASLGTPFMTVAAASDTRITQLWSVHGAGNSEALLAHNARRSVPDWFCGPAGYLADALVGGRFLTPEKWVARVAPRPFTMINATEDERLPRAAILALYNAAREPKNIVWLPGPHVQANRPEVVRALINSVFDQMARARASGGGTPLRQQHTSTGENSRDGRVNQRFVAVS